MFLTNVFDRVASQLGYQRVAPQLPERPDEAIAVPELPPHLVSESEFDFSRAHNNQDWTFFYEIAAGFHFAIGRHGWMPIAMAGFIVGGNRADGQSLMSAAITERLWLPERAPAHASWLQANNEAIDEIAAIDFHPEQEDSEATTFSPSMYLNLEASVVSSELKTMWRRAKPLRTETFLATTKEYNLLWQQPVMREARNAPQAALSQLLNWTADWFQARGFAVDKEKMLVAVPNYQPLFYIDTDPGAF